MAWKSEEAHRAYQREYYKKNKLRCNAMSEKWYQKNRSEIISRYHSDTEYREAKQLSKRMLNKLHREKVLQAYGNQCACCGEKQQEFLAIDHIAGGGYAHRKSIDRKGGQAFYAWLRMNGYPSGFQVLCHNCNMAKGFYGKCPHENIVGAFIRKGLGIVRVA